jgi:hypothetical protein
MVQPFKFWSSTLRKRTAVCPFYYFCSSMLSKRTAVYFWSSTHIKIHYQSSESKQSNSTTAGNRMSHWSDWTSVLVSTEFRRLNTWNIRKSFLQSINRHIFYEKYTAIAISIREQNSCWHLSYIITSVNEINHGKLFRRFFGEEQICHRHILGRLYLTTPSLLLPALNACYAG